MFCAPYFCGSQACESRDWALVRLTAGLLNRQLDELAKAVTYLLVRQKQLTLGIPSKKEEAITCPKTKEELSKILARTYGDDPNSYTLSQVFIPLLHFRVMFILEFIEVHGNC